MWSVKSYKILIKIFSLHILLNWGFYAHKMINYHAVFTLHEEVLDFYKEKKNIKYFVQKAGVPDNRKFIPGYRHEKFYHYIDLDFYDIDDSDDWKSVFDKTTKKYNEKHGIVPWSIIKVQKELTQAFKNQNRKRILKLSVDIAHYIGDSTMPLHTTKNYDGQATNQRGIHNFYETRLPELFSKNYDFIVGKAEYIKNPMEVILTSILETHRLINTLLECDREVSKKMLIGRYAYEKRGKSGFSRMFSKEYAKAYHDLIGKQVEQQMCRAVKLVGDFIYTCWVDADKPDLKNTK